MDQALLFRDDIETWAERQVFILRRLAAEPGARSNEIDWANVIEEIESLGARDRQAVESILENALSHVLKVWADPSSLSSRHWRAEIAAFLKQARIRMRPGMRPRIDLEAVWRDAAERACLALEAYDRGFPDAPPSRCPVSLDAVLADPFDLDAVLRALP